MMQVIDLILLYDGDVMKFAGDSMIVAFSPSKEEETAEDGGLKEATLRCLHCASDLVDKYGEFVLLNSGLAQPSHCMLLPSVAAVAWALQCIYLQLLCDVNTKSASTCCCSNGLPREHGMQAPCA